MNNWNIEIIKDWNIIFSEKNKKKWMEVLDKSPNAHVFFHPALVEAWVETYRPLRKLEPLFIWGTHDDIQVVFPLVRWKRNWKNAFQKMIVPMGYSDFDYHDPIFSKEVSSEEIQSFYVKLLSYLKDFDSIVFDGIHSGFIPDNFQVLFEEPCPRIDLSGFDSIDSYIQSLSKNNRKSYQRRKSNLESEYEVSYSICDNLSKDNEIKENISSMLKLHSERWPNAYKAPKFHQLLIKKGMESGVLIIYQIKAGENIVSWQLSFLFKNSLMLYMPIMNPEFLNYSPGTLSLLFCVEDALNRELKEIDQLRGEESYKKNWTPDANMIYNVSFENKSLSSLSKKILSNLRKILQK